MDSIKIKGILAKEKKYDLPLVFVHGAWVGAWCWEEYFLPFFADQGFDVYALELRGRNNVSLLPDINPPGLEEYIKDLVRGLDALEENAILIGHSMGAFLLQHYLARFHAEAALLLAPIPPIGVSKVSLRFTMQHPFEAGLLNMNMFVPPLRTFPSSAIPLLFSKETNKEAAESYLTKMRSESPKLFLDAGFPLKPTLKNEDAPIIVMGCREDNIILVEEVEQTAKAYHTEAVFVDKPGHMCMLDAHWKTVAEAMLKELLRISVLNQVQ